MFINVLGLIRQCAASEGGEWGGIFLGGFKTLILLGLEGLEERGGREVVIVKTVSKYSLFGAIVSLSHSRHGSGV